MYINIYLCNNALYLYSFSKLIITYQSWYDHHFLLLWLYVFSNLNLTYNRKYISYKHLGQKHHLFIFSLILIWKKKKKKKNFLFHHYIHFRMLMLFQARLKGLVLLLFRIICHFQPCVLIKGFFFFYFLGIKYYMQMVFLIFFFFFYGVQTFSTWCRIQL